MKESRKEFIIKAHKEACSEWKQNIEQEFPKLFKSEELYNGWYKDSQNEWCMFFQDGMMEYGFNTHGNWREDMKHFYSPFHSDYKATDQEVEEALIKEAKKRGFKEGVRIEPPVSHLKKGVLRDDGRGFYFFNKMSSFWFGGSMLFKEGKWATITETITKAEAEKELGKTII